VEVGGGLIFKELVLVRKVLDSTVKYPELTSQNQKNLPNFPSKINALLSRLALKTVVIALGKRQYFDFAQ
jgi:hypothetical protein